jgi:hypothetical protein
MDRDCGGRRKGGQGHAVRGTSEGPRHETWDAGARGAAAGRLVLSEKDERPEGIIIANLFVPTEVGWSTL